MRRWRAVPVVAAVLLGAGCSGDDDPPAAAPTSAAPAGSAAASGSPSATPTAAALPTGCDSMLPFTDLDQAIGRPLFGRTVFTEGVAQPSIGRLGRVTCGYGLPASGRGARAPVGGEARQHRIQQPPRLRDVAALFGKGRLVQCAVEAARHDGPLPMIAIVV